MFQQVLELASKNIFKCPLSEAIIYYDKETMSEKITNYLNEELKAFRVL